MAGFNEIAVMFGLNTIRTIQMTFPNRSDHFDPPLTVLSGPRKDFARREAGFIQDVSHPSDVPPWANRSEHFNIRWRGKQTQFTDKLSVAAKP